MDSKVIAFYLPQYYPFKENNEWYGEGFTEWTNVGKAKPLFKGHYQPRVPSTLGYYDLRLPQVRQRQAELAKKAGVAAFCYYHYWFGDGRLLLEKPLEEVIRLKEPDFPFCICWANHSWSKKQWNPDTKELEQSIIMQQTYSGREDIIQHFDYLLPMFKDERYYKIEGKLPFVIYDNIDIPNFPELKEVWNELALKNGLPEFFFIAYTADPTVVDTETYKQYDAVIVSLITNVVYRGNYSLFRKRMSFLFEKVSSWLGKPHLVFDYSQAIRHLTDPIAKRDTVIPTLVPNWDWSPRRGAGGLIYKNSTPELFAKHVRQTLDLIKDKPASKQIIFLKSWNEWGEGNYMEPDLRFGEGYIEALNNELRNS